MLFILYFSFLLFEEAFFFDPSNRRNGVCSVSSMCGDGYCCMYSGGCFCSHYECMAFCSHGDNIPGKFGNNQVINSAAKQNIEVNPPAKVKFLDYPNDYHLNHDGGRLYMGNDFPQKPLEPFPVTDNGVHEHYPTEIDEPHHLDQEIEIPMKNKIFMISPEPDKVDKSEENHPVRVLDRTLTDYAKEEEINKRMQDIGMNNQKRRAMQLRQYPRLKKYSRPNMILVRRNPNYMHKNRPIIIKNGEMRFTKIKNIENERKKLYNDVFH